jgi:acetylornithine deacetylase/succinyl-diaminopimelate desuccinylase-like protein
MAGYMAGALPTIKQGLVHLAAVSLARELLGQKRSHFKFLIEGEEEAGSSGLEVLLAEHKDLLKADAVIVADLNNIEKGLPVSPLVLEA